MTWTRFSEALAYALRRHSPAVCGQDREDYTLCRPRGTGLGDNSGAGSLRRSIKNGKTAGPASVQEGCRIAAEGGERIMADFTIKNPPEYDPALRMLEPTDPNHADVFNQLYGQLINNEAFLAELARRTAQALAEHLGSDAVHVTEQDKQEWNAKAGTAAATQADAGLMAAADKTKLDGVAAGAEVNQNAYSNIKVGSVTVTANGKTAAFTLEAGNNINLSANNAAKKIIIAANRDGGNADTVDGYHASSFAAAGHGHDGRYYTKTESDNLLKGKAASSHTHTRSQISDFPTSMTPVAHNQAAGTITAGTLAGKVRANAAAAKTLADAQVRDIYAGTTDMTAGTTALTDGVVYLFYE